jgi:hypothetical protein
MFLSRLAVPTLVLCLGATGLITATAYSAPPTPLAAGYGQDRGGWDAIPREFNEIQRRGFHDGMDGARRDFENHRRPDVNNRDEYRRPAVSRDLREVYRDGFRRGYERAVSHFWGTPDMPMRAPDMPMRQPDRVVSPPDRGGWEAPPSEFSEVQRRGFRDGMEGARKDVDNHRRPDVNNRDEYRHPDVPYELRRQYREAFRRGYDVAMSHLMH